MAWWDLVGNKHTKSVPSEAAGERFRELSQELIDHRSALETAAVQFREPDGTTVWWSELLSAMAHRLVTCTDQADKDTIRKDLQAIGNASKAIKPLVDQADIDKRIAEMEAMLDEVVARRRHGAGTRGKIDPNPEYPGAGLEVS